MSNKLKPYTKKLREAVQSISNNIEDMTNIRIRVMAASEVALNMPALVVGMPTGQNEGQWVISMVPAMLEIQLFDEVNNEPIWVPVPFKLYEEPVIQ